MMRQYRSDDESGGDGRLPPHFLHAYHIRREQDGRRDIASGSFHSLGPPTSRKRSPVAQPKSALRMRPRKLTTARFTWGSIDATIALMAQIGLVLAPNWSRSQRSVAPTKTFTAR